MGTLDDWITDAAEALHLPAEALTHDLRDALLDLTREVAHGVARPAGPLTTYLVGLAVGAGTAPSTAIAGLSELAATRADEGGDGETGSAAPGAESGA